MTNVTKARNQLAAQNMHNSLKVAQNVRMTLC
jgi:hypothetical protein